jgi:hypothetical protein
MRQASARPWTTDKSAQERQKPRPKVSGTIGTRAKSAGPNGAWAGVAGTIIAWAVGDRGTAQLLSASLMYYAMPRADSLPLFRTEISEVSSRSCKR